MWITQSCATWKCVSMNCNVHNVLTAILEAQSVNSTREWRNIYNRNLHRCSVTKNSAMVISKFLSSHVTEFQTGYDSKKRFLSSRKILNWTTSLREKSFSILSFNYLLWTLTFTLFLARPEQADFIACSDVIFLFLLSWHVVKLLFAHCYLTLICLHFMSMIKVELHRKFGL